MSFDADDVVSPEGCCYYSHAPTLRPNLVGALRLRELSAKPAGNLAITMASSSWSWSWPNLLLLLMRWSWSWSWLLLLLVVVAVMAVAALPNLTHASTDAAMQ